MAVEVIGLITEVCDRLAGALKDRAENRRQFFKDFIEPIYQDLLKIHENYASILTEVRAIAGAGNASVRVIRLEIGRRREALWHIRTATHAQVDVAAAAAGAVGVADDGKQGRSGTSAFVYAAARYLFLNTAEGGRMDGVPSSRLTGLIGMLERTEDSLCDAGGEQAIATLDHSRRELESDWRSVAYAFAACKGELLA